MSQEIAQYIRTVDAQILKDFPSLAPLNEIAWRDYGVKVGLFQYENPYPDSHPKSGIYAVVCPDAHTIGVLQKGTVSLRNILLDNEEMHPNEVALYYNSIYLGDISRKNEYKKLRQIEKAIKNISTAKYAFQEYGLDLPRTMQQVTIDKFARYNNIRHATNLRQEVRQEYETVMRHAVEYANELYNKDTDYSHRSVVPVSSVKGQMVEKEHFEKNHIVCVNEVVSDDFWRYLQEHMSKCPGFKIWKDKKPSHVLKDNSDTKGVLGLNIWAAQKGYREYNVMFASGQAAFFYSWLLDYRCQELKRLKSDKEMMESTKELQAVTIPADDLKIWDMYCEANDVGYGINHGLFGDNSPETIRNPIIMVRAEDRPLVDGILHRMAEDDIKQVVYAEDDRKRVDQMRRKCVDNPYLRLLQMESRTDQIR